ncbi:MAG: PHP domain-containing protein, partial [Clostridiales bacterium]|nr:PHP domain-containing protein [Clostridiales bacterium]
MEKRIEALRANAARQNQPARQSVEAVKVASSVYKDNPELIVEDGTVKTGYMKFDITNAELLIGEDFEIVPSRLHDAPSLSGRAVFIGEVINKEVRPKRRGIVPFSFCIHDGNAALTVKAALPQDKADKYEAVNDGMSVAVFGELTHDEFDGELVLAPISVKKVNQIYRSDNAPEKRVELHLHTTMSQMDAIIPPDVAVKTAKNWGHRAIAITDHGNVQGFQEAAKAASKIGMKILYGMEGYFVDDTTRAVYGTKSESFDNEFVVFDIETTGLSALSCKITEIGAVRVKNDEVLEIFSTFVDPETHIPEKITELTGITDEMVAGAPKTEEAVRDFLNFAGGRTLIAHNAQFDTSFIRKACDDYGIPFTNDFLDTVSISHYVNPDLKKHKLDILAEYYNLGDFGHHRAYNDAEMTAKIFYRMIDKLRDEGIYNTLDMSKAMDERSSPTKQRAYHQILIAKNYTGLKNLYKIVSNGYLNCFYRYPCIPKSFLEQHREGLLVGSACEAGELYSAILETKPEDEIKAIAEFYDYLEIQPLSSNSFLVAEGKVADFEALRDIN